jgi:GntR family transcriptional regulator, vanillate catabolism transcriptional regulator
VSRQQGAPSSTVVQQVADAIRIGVRNGMYVPGQRLIESDLTEVLGVSRGPLREALGRLESEGLVVIEPHRGAVVRKAARLAALHIAAGDHRARMQQQLDEVLRARAGSEPLTYMDHNSRFHDEIFAVSQNTLLAQLAVQLQTQSYRIQFAQLLRGETERTTSGDDHVLIVEAILAGRGAAAEKAMRRHVRRSAEVTAAFPDSAFGLVRS